MLTYIIAAIQVGVGVLAPITELERAPVPNAVAVVSLTAAAAAGGKVELPTGAMRVVITLTVCYYYNYCYCNAHATVPTILTTTRKLLLLLLLLVPLCSNHCSVPAHAHAVCKLHVISAYCHTEYYNRCTQSWALYS
jgi:hypothetical protein